MKKQTLILTAILLVVAVLSPLVISPAVDARPGAAMPVEPGNMHAWV